MSIISPALKTTPSPFASEKYCPLVKIGNVYDWQLKTSVKLSTKGIALNSTLKLDSASQKPFVL